MFFVKVIFRKIYFHCNQFHVIYCKNMCKKRDVFTHVSLYDFMKSLYTLSSAMSASLRLRLE